MEKGSPGARSIQPKFPEISVQNSMDRFGPTGKVSKKLVHLLRWSSFPGRTGLKFGSMDRAPGVSNKIGPLAYGFRLYMSPNFLNGFKISDIP